jgi:hypothetical protein
MSDSGERKARSFAAIGADIVSTSARDGSGYRILIPPSGGSNPPAPATHSRNWETSPDAAQSPAFCGPLRTRRVETDGTGRVAPVLSARSPMPIFQSPEFASGCARPARAGSHAAGLRVRSADATRACSRFRCFARAGGEPDQPRPSCSSGSVQGSGRFRVSCVTAMSAGARPSAMA